MAWHVDGLADCGSASPDEGASGPAAGLPGYRREAGETCGLACLEGAELGHFDEQGEGGYGRDARNAGEDCEPLGEIGVNLDLLEDCRLDCRHLAIDLLEQAACVACRRERDEARSAPISSSMSRSSLSSCGAASNLTVF